MLIATILGSSIAFIDGSVVNIALPAIQRELQATSADMQWMVEAYLLFLSAFLLVGGSLGDYLGRRRIFASGIMLFTLASIWCGFSPNVSQLIVARGVQGLGGALLVPGSLSIISASFEDERRGQAIGTWSGFTAVTSVIGPVLGGWLVSFASWRWIFFINLPLAIIVLLILFRHVPESRNESLSNGLSELDWQGTLLITLGLAGIVYGLITVSALGLNHPRVLGALAIGIIALAAFLFVETRIPNPIVPLSLFRSRTFSGANLLTLLLYGALAATTYFLPFNLIQIQGYSAAIAGTALTPFALTMFLLSRWAAALRKRYGAKLPLILGPTITAVGFALFAIPGIGANYWITFFPAIIVMSLGMAITVAPLTTTIMNAVEQSHSGTASGVNNTVSRTAGLLAIAMMGIVMLNVFSNHLEYQLASMNVSPNIRQAVEAQNIKLAGIEIPQGTSNQVHTLIKQAIDEAFMSGFRIVMIICSALALLSALIAWIMIDSKSPRNLPNISGD